MSEEGLSPETGSESAPSPEGGQVESSAQTDTGAEKTSEGQGEAAPSLEGGQVSKAPGGDKSDNAKAEETDVNTPKWDGDTLNWMESKGYDQSSYDPANSSHSRLINSAREAEKRATKAEQDQKTQEAFDRAQKVSPKPKIDAEVVTPMDEIKNTFASKVQTAMEVHSVSTEKELHAANPDLYDKLYKEGLKVEQDMWIAKQEYEKSQKAAQEEETRIKEQMRTDFLQAKETSDRNLADLRAKHPNLDTNFKKHGVDAFMKVLSDKYSVFPEMLYLDKNVAKFFAQAADAIEYRYGEEVRKKGYIEEYEKQQLLAKAAQGPRPAGGGPGGVTGGSASTDGSWDNNLMKGSKKLVPGR